MSCGDTPRQVGEFSQLKDGGLSLHKQSDFAVRPLLLIVALQGS